MKKFLFALLMLKSIGSNAQSVDMYIFKVETGKTYTPLMSATNLTSGLKWDDESFKIPMGFTADIGGKSTSFYSIVTSGVLAPSSDTESTINAFAPYEADLAERSISGPLQSPIRYKIDGVSPKRIFKLEFFNAGFFSEQDKYSTNYDSVNFQVWLYETSNIVEFRYGPSKITYPSDYFDGTAPIVGYFKNINYTTFIIDKIYTFSGNPTSPKIDSTTIITSTPPLLTSPPSEGTVYRFIPKSIVSSIGEIDVTKNFKIYPTVATNQITVDYNQSNIASAEILDLSGKLIKGSIKLNNGTNNIDVYELIAGQYLIRLSNESGSAVYKFFKR